MRKDIKEFLKFLDEELLDKNQKLYKWQEQWIETYLEQHTEEKANEKMHGELDERRSPRIRKLPNGCFRRPCFR